jgi:hypothetical protein
MRKLYLFLSILCVAVLATSAALWSPGAQQPTQSSSQTDVQKARRDARFSRGRTYFSISSMADGTVERGITDFVEPDDYFSVKPDGSSLLSRAEKVALEEKAAPIAAAKRKSDFCGSTIVVSGQAVSRQGYITSDDSAIYTVYQFTVHEIFRAPQDLQLNVGSTIEVSVRGGFAKTASGAFVGVEDSQYPPLSFKQRHILSLKYDAEAKDYYPIDPRGMYRILDDGRVVRGDHKHHFYLRRSKVAKEPDNEAAVSTELRSTNCSQ